MGLFSKNSSTSTTNTTLTTNTLDMSSAVGSLGIIGSTVSGGAYSNYAPINIQVGDKAISSNPLNNPTVSVPVVNPGVGNVATSLVDQLTSSTALHSFLLYGIAALVILHFLKK